MLVIRNIVELVSETKKNSTAYLTPDFILDYASSVYQVDKKLVVSKNRSAAVSGARHLCVALLRKHTDLSLSQIGLFLGGRSHSTVLSCLKKTGSSSLFLKEVNTFDNKLKTISFT